MITGRKQEANFEEIEPGTYLCQLTDIKGLEDDENTPEEQRTLKDVWSKDKKTGEKEAALRFVFQVEGKRAYICKTVKSSIHKKSAAFKIMQELTDSICRDVEFDPESEVASEEVFMAKFKPLINKFFKVTCDMSKNGKYVVYKSAAPVDAPPEEESSQEELFNAEDGDEKIPW